MNLFGKLQSEYQHLWKQIIRPSRTHYSEEMLGPPRFVLEGISIIRRDFQMVSMRGFMFQGSIWMPEKKNKCECVVYLHGSQGNRTEGMEYLAKLMKKNIALCTFDFCGCGNAEGEYITMGYYEQHDVKLVVDYLKSLEEITQFSIWGKGMGAVSALFFLGKTIDIKALVLDTPYKSLKSLIEEIMKKNSKMPAIVINGAIKMISKTIQDKAGFDIANVNPLKYTVPGLQCPVLFIVPTGDESLSYENIKQLYDAYSGERKEIYLVKNQNDSRTEQCVNNCINFFTRHFGKNNNERQQQSEYEFFSPKSETKATQDKPFQKQVDLHQYDDRIRQNPSKVNEIHNYEEKKKKDFSLLGIFSVFSRDSKKEEIQVDRRQQKTEWDQYGQFRNKILEKEKKNESNNSWYGSQKILKLEAMMKQEISSMDQKPSKEFLNNWIYTSV